MSSTVDLHASIHALPLFEDAYDLGPEIGRGGMGIVYEATHRNLGRCVAAKKLFPHLMDEEDLLSRFLQEAAVVAQLSHPGIVVIHDICRDGLGVPCIVMERLSGRPLDAILDETRRLAPERAVSLTAQAAEAIAHAHEHGVIHRDIKPANLMVLPNDRVKVMDFGLARSSEVKHIRRLLRFSVFDTPDRIYGSFHYMSPEHIDIRTVGERSDVYSLGVVLYHALTGRLPFFSAHPMAILSMHINQAPLRPDTYAPEIGEALSLDVLRALEKNPENRPRSAAEWAESLKRSVRGARRAHPLSDNETESTPGIAPDASSAPGDEQPASPAPPTSRSRSPSSAGGVMSSSTREFAERLRRRRMRSLRNLAVAGFAFAALFGIVAVGFGFWMWERFATLSRHALVSPEAPPIEPNWNLDVLAPRPHAFPAPAETARRESTEDETTTRETEETRIRTARTGSARRSRTLPPPGDDRDADAETFVAAASPETTPRSSHTVAFARPLTRRGEEALEQNNLKLAAMNFAKAIEYMPSLGEAYLGLARVYAREGRKQEARHLLETALAQEDIVLPSNLRLLARIWIDNPNLMVIETPEPPRTPTQ